MSIRLPKQFAELQPFAATWALATEYERAAQRRRSQPHDLQAFYAAAIKKLPAILKRVDKYPLGKIEGVDVHLFRLALSLAEIAHTSSSTALIRGSPLPSARSVCSVFMLACPTRGSAPPRAR